MSDVRDTQTKPLTILNDAEDYPSWKSHVISKLQHQNCEWAIAERPIPNFELVKVNFILDSFAQADLRPSTLVSALRNEIKDHLSGLGKAASTIKDHVNASFHPILQGKTPPEMWTILEDRLQHISPMSIVAGLTDGCLQILLEFKNVIDYTSSYQQTLDKVASLTKERSHMHAQTAEMMLQANMFQNLGSKYSALVSAIQME